MKNSGKEVSKKWTEALQSEGYEHHVYQKSDCVKLAKFSRVWRRIFSVINLSRRSKDQSVFEVGCGGGKHLVAFTLNDWKTYGIDVSREVLDRAENYAAEISSLCRKELDISFILGDFFDYNEDEKFDLVFHVGVLEHFLDDNVRLLAIRKMFQITRPGGYIVSIVPSGTHPIRQKMKKMKLGGYNIPEIDYTPELMAKELKSIGGKEIKILPHNILCYFLIDTASGLSFFFKKILFYIFQIIPPELLPKKFAARHAGTLIAIAKK